MAFRHATEMLKRGVRSPATYEALVRRQAAKYGTPLIEMVVPAQVYVNCGRTVADCVCGAGMAVDPDWAGFCGCLACFRVYRTVLVPVDLPAIEQALEALPTKHQSWAVEEDMAAVTHRVKLVKREPIEREPVKDDLPIVVDDAPVEAVESLLNEVKGEAP